MNRISDKDYLFIGVLLFILGVVAIASDRGRGKRLPVDLEHQSIYDGIRNGRSVNEVELVCTTCHGKSSTPLPKDHPRGEQCLLCHVLV